MKKGVYITIGILALLAVMVWADRKFPPPTGSPSASMSAGVAQEPSVTVKGLDDRDISLQQYKGKVVLVNFWATWCDPCKSEIPLLIELQQKYGSRGLVILGLSMDEDGKKAVEPFLSKERFDVDGQKEAIDYTIALANDTIAEKFGGVMGLPTSVLFSRDGKALKRVVGPVDMASISKDIENAL